MERPPRNPNIHQQHQQPKPPDSDLVTVFPNRSAIVHCFSPYQVGLKLHLGVAVLLVIQSPRVSASASHQLRVDRPSAPGFSARRRFTTSSMALSPLAADKACFIPQ